MVTNTEAQSSVDELLAALRRSHERLVGVTASLSDQRVSEPSYDADWTIAQVLSHLGSGAEVFTMLLDSGLRGQPAPGVEQFQPIWDRWNAKPAVDQAREGVSSDASFLDSLDRLSPEGRDAWRLDLFGAEQTLSGVLRMRLAEHALHTWDIAVVLDSAATVAADAAGLIVDDLPMLVERVGRPVVDPVTVNVRTSAPARHHRLDVTRDGVTELSRSMRCWWLLWCECREAGGGDLRRDSFRGRRLPEANKNCLSYMEQAVIPYLVANSEVRFSSRLASSS
jgi:uncharacterized protein (TIGR03083 family)